MYRDRETITLADVLRRSGPRWQPMDEALGIADSALVTADSRPRSCCRVVVITSTLGEVEDPYLRLRPLPPTPPDEVCSCSDCPPILLMWTIGPNPIHCLHCNLEIEPPAVPLPADLVDEVAHWAMLDGAIEHLELDSGPYEEWAQRELLNLQSPVNIEGLALRRTLDPIRRCYLVLFQPMDADGRFVVPPVCPQCGSAFETFSHHGFTRLLCHPCGLALTNP